MKLLLWRTLHCFLILAGLCTQAFLLPTRQFRKHVSVVWIHVGSRIATFQCTVVQAKRKGAQQDDNDPEIDISQVSDAEALLACRAYLQRRKRLGEWTQLEQRKRQAKFASLKDHSSTRSVGGPGYFWEDPSQLKYLNRDPDSILENNALKDELLETIVDAEDDMEERFVEPEKEEAIWETVNGQVTMPRVNFQPEDGDEVEEDDLTGTDEFLAFDATPSPSHIRRSQAAKRTWSDPEFRAKWYERRWGDSHLNRKKKLEKKRIEERLRAIDPDTLLANDELAAMTEEEIAEAIRSYVVSNRKRAASRKHTLQERKKALKEPMANNPVPRDSLLQTDPKALEAARRQRSERAAKAYQKRLNKKQGDKERPKMQPFLRFPTNATPKEALLRIQIDLHHDKLPSIDDIQLILQPLKLAKRKDTLRRILSDCFELRGKCVPADLENPDESDLSFVTQCSIEQLGEFVLYKVKEATKTNADSL